MTERNPKKRRHFGKVRKLPSGRFQASFIDPKNGKRIVGPDTFRTKTAADNWLAGIQADLNRGELPNLTLGRMTFEAWAEQWLETRQIKANTLSRYKTIVRGILIPEFGHRKLNSITRNDIVKFVASVSQTSDSENRAHDVRRFLSMILSEAVRSNAIKLNPAEGVKVKRTKKEEMIFLSRQQVADLSKSISVRTLKYRGGHPYQIDCPQYGLLVRFVTETGLRAGEVAALRVGRINLTTRRVEVAESVTEVSKDDAPHGLLYGPTKNYERRSVPLPKVLAKELAEHLADRPTAGSALVFTAPDGGPLRHNNFYGRIYKPAVIETESVPDETRFHDLRHTYAALLIAAGANPLTVKQRMGHSSITVTMDRYGHLFPHLEAEITDAMDAEYREIHGHEENGD